MGFFSFFCFLFTTQVEQFWGFYSYLVRPGDLTGHSDIHLFKDGIKPMWEVGYLQFLNPLRRWQTELYKYFIFTAAVIQLRKIEGSTVIWTCEFQGDQQRKKKKIFYSPKSQSEALRTTALSYSTALSFLRRGKTGLPAGASSTSNKLNPHVVKAGITQVPRALFLERWLSLIQIKPNFRHGFLV